MPRHRNGCGYQGATEKDIFAEDDPIHRAHNWRVASNIPSQLARLDLQNSTHGIVGYVYMDPEECYSLAQELLRTYDRLVGIAGGCRS